MSDVIQQLGEFWYTIRQDGINSGVYIEHLTYLMLVKMADERGIALPKDCDWPSLMEKSNTALPGHYVDLLRNLAAQRGLIGRVFRLAPLPFNDPVNLGKLNSVNWTRLLGLIDQADLTTLDIDADVAQFERRSAGIRNARANEEVDSGLERQILRAHILCRTLLAMLMKESVATLRRT